MAYAALLSLSQTLDQILMDHKKYPLTFEQENLFSLDKNVIALLTFVEEYSEKCRGVVNPLENRIITATYLAEDIIECRFLDGLSDSFLVNLFESCISTCWSEQERNSANLRKVLKKIESILDDAMKIKNNPTENKSTLDFSGPLSLSQDVTSDINTMVLEDDFELINTRIYNKSRKFDVIPIVGMGGIGKSTLARRLYGDSMKRGYFDRCLWIVVSQDYSLRKVLSEFMLAIGKAVNKERTDGELKQVIYQELFGRRYVIVLDDLWSEKPWNDLNMILPKETAGSRVLVTTRLYGVASYVGSSFTPPHEVQLLDNLKSWILFEESVFGKGSSCPLVLEEIGKKVAKSCQGLPLTIVLIAGLLKGDTTKEYWENISENISSSEPTIALQSSKVLSLSYNHLPLYLKPCFLYVTMFPEDYEISANRLIRLWMAEGFVKPSGLKHLEEVAEGYLYDLLRRSLLMVSKMSRYKDKIKTIRIHDVLRDFATSNAEQERFQYHRDLRSEYRRVTANKSSLKLLLKFSNPATRSVLVPNIFIWGRYSFKNLRLLRVLDAGSVVNLMEREVTKSVHVRYLSIRTYSRYKYLTLELPNIQTLIVQTSRDIIVPLEIWRTPSLRHLILSPNVRLQLPSGDDIFEKTGLQMMSVSQLRFTKRVIEMLLNLRKLKVCYGGERKVDCAIYYDLINLIHLRKLEKLRIKFPSVTATCIYGLAFPKSLTKLSLTHIHGYWEDLSVIGSLPKLQVFEITCFGSTGGVWEPIEGQFLKLKNLKLEEIDYLDHWEGESIHFPSLETLILKCMKGRLSEIPSGIGEIDTLRVIELVDCNESIVDSAKQIQAYQWEMGNQDLQLLVATSDDSQDIIYKEIRPDGY